MNSYYEKFPDGKVTCIDEEIPFEIPEGWEWCRLSNVISLLSGQDLTPDRYFDTETGIPYITGASHFVDGSIVLSRWTKTPTSISKKGDLLITCKGTVGTMAYNTIGDVHIARQIMAITPICVCLKYLQIFLTFIVPELEKQAHSIIPGISRDILLNTIVSLPPLQEQIRISETVDKITPYLEKYAKAQYSLDALNSNIKVSLKRSILQEAIQGKLVPQIASEGDASVLLQQIEMEKQRLVKEGKLKKKDLVSSTIYRGDDNKYYEHVGSNELDITDQIPFDIPESWSWARLAHIAILFTGNSISETEKSQKYTGVSGMCYVGTKDVGFDSVIAYENGVKIPDEFRGKFKVAESNSVLLCVEGGSAGRKYGITDKDICFGNKLCCITPYGIPSKFIFYYIQSASFYDFFTSSMTGIIGGVSVNSLKNILIPIPPENEQHRIIEKVQSLFNCIK